MNNRRFCLHKKAKGCQTRRCIQYAPKVGVATVHFLMQNPFSRGGQPIWAEQPRECGAMKMMPGQSEKFVRIGQYGLRFLE
jgi:hypothetical protein